MDEKAKKEKELSSIKLGQRTLKTILKSENNETLKAMFGKEVDKVIKLLIFQMG